MWTYEPFAFMPSTKQIGARRYRDGSTLTISSLNDNEVYGVGLISIAEARSLLAIATHDTMNSYLKVLGYYKRSFLNWGQFRELVFLQEFLRLRHGENSKSMYLYMRSQGQISQLFESSSIDIEERFRRLQDSHWKKQRLPH